MKRIAIALLLAGCSSSDAEQPPALDAAPDTQLEAAPEAAPDGAGGVHEGGAGAGHGGGDATKETGTDSQAEAETEAGHDAPVEDVVSEPACVPEYLKTDSKTDTSSGADLVITVELACEPGETTPAAWWLGLCESSGDVKSPCSCMHVGTSGVQCSLVTNGTATLKLTIHCARDCEG